MSYVVIKCGGSVFDALPDSFFKSIVKLHKQNICTPVIVHGGGPFISKLLDQTGVETKFINGLRITTDEVLDVVEMALSGSMNKQIVRKLAEAEGEAYGISGVDGALLSAEKKATETELGFVGEVKQVKKTIIDNIAGQGFIPVISPLGIDEKGQRYNINADDAAAAVASELKAKLCFISDIAGIMTEENGEKVVIHEADKEAIEALIEQEVITGGMIPKVQSALDALKKGVPEVTIINGMEDDSLTQLLNGKKIGTRIVLNKEVPYV